MIASERTLIQMRWDRSLLMAILLTTTNASADMEAIPSTLEGKVTNATEFTTAVTKDPGSDACIILAPEDGHAIRLGGVPSSALLALTWMDRPLRLEGELHGEDARTFELEGLSDPNPPEDLPLDLERRGILQRSPYGLYLRQAEGDPLRLAGPFTTFLERLAPSRMLVSLRGSFRGGSFLVVSIRLRAEPSC